MPHSTGSLFNLSPFPSLPDSPLNDAATIRVCSLYRGTTRISLVKRGIGEGGKRFVRNRLAFKPMHLLGDDEGCAV